MSLDFTALGDLARQSPGKTKAGWQPLTRDDLGYGQVLAFDQSLTATGWVLLGHDLDRLVVHHAGRWAAVTEGSDVATSLSRGTQVYSRARMTFEHYRNVCDAFVHESPPNPAAVKGGGYSSLLAAQSLRDAAFASGITMEMLGAQPGKKLVCGNANADKKTAHAALKACYPWIEGAEKVTNEATRDALIVALLWLSRRPR